MTQQGDSSQYEGGERGEPAGTSEGDRGANVAQGETHGRAQEPVEAGEHDSVQQEQARREGQPSGHDPAAPDAEVEDSLTMTHSPDAAYGQHEDQA